MIESHCQPICIDVAGLAICCGLEVRGGIESPRWCPGSIVASVACRDRCFRVIKAGGCKTSDRVAGKAIVCCVIVIRNETLSLYRGAIVTRNAAARNIVMTEVRRCPSNS